MTDAAAADPDHGILVVRGSRERGFTYVLLRGPGLRLGDDTVIPSAADQAPLTRVVEDLATAPEPGDVAGARPATASPTSTHPRPPTSTWWATSTASAG